MPLSFDAAAKAAGIKPPTYVPLADRAANSTTGGLLPGSNGTAVSQGVRKPNIAQDTKTNPTSAPSNADAAPNAQSITIFTGLCDALNQFQQDLKTKGLLSIPDEYEILFAPSSMEQEKVTLKGTTAYKSTPMVTVKNPNAQLNTNTDSMSTTSRAISVEAGTQIIQFIDQVMRGSTYITKQANVIFDEATGTASPNLTANNSSGFNWYKITFQTTSLGWDTIRQDFAYKMTYIVNQYTVTDIQSQFFKPGAFRGTHKSFHYWFTGQNTQILDFEQEYNNLYGLILMSPPNSGAPASEGGTPETGPSNVLSNLINTPITPVNNLPPLTRSFAAGASVSSQYADKGAALIGSSAADYLYAMSNQSTIKLKVVGDPAWLMQGEVTNSIDPQNFSWSPFNADGAINFEAGQVLFDVTWNRPGDYDFQTGLMDTSGQTRNADGSLALLQPQAHTVYVAQTVRSTFAQGKFEQEIEGKAYLNNAIAAASEREKARAVAPEGETVPTTNPRLPERDFDTIEENAATNTTNNPNPAVQAAVGPVVVENLQPQAPAQPPSSNGDIDVFAGLAGTSGGFTAPQDAAAAVAAANGAQPALTPEQRQIADMVTLSAGSQLMAPKDA